MNQSHRGWVDKLIQADPEAYRRIKAAAAIEDIELREALRRAMLEYAASRLTAPDPETR